MIGSRFKRLYVFCQTLDPKVSRAAIKAQLEAIYPERKLRTIKTELDVEVVKGFFLNASNKDHPFVRDNGFNVIVLARGMNYCWERFVTVKEMMHLFDDDGYLTDSANSFEGLLVEWENRDATSSKQMQSEIYSFWMALACLCPEKDRARFADLKSRGLIDDYGVALQLKIPEKCIQSLFSERYEKFLAKVNAIN